MLKVLGRIAIVLACGFVVLLVLQFAFSRGTGPRARHPHADMPPTRAPTVADVAAAHLPTPTLTRVSFPEFSYRDAFPGATDEAEVVITNFSGSPILESPAAVPEEWRIHFPDPLPPAAERLPRNPAVVRGPDGMGNYGGVWRRCNAMSGDISTKIGYESFVRHGPSGELQPCLAYKWTVENNNRVFTFYMRKGHRWSDGHPFTVEDILWVCNTVIGSAQWSSPPNWMQASDGTALLFRHDVTDWQGLASRILEQGREKPESPGSVLLRIGGEKLELLLADMTAGNGDIEKQQDLVEMLNELFRNPALWDARAWSGVDLDAEIETWSGRGFSRLTRTDMQRVDLLLERKDLVQRATLDVSALTASELSKLHLLLFRAAYADCVNKAELRRVKVEAVPDAHGDAGHIIRFTFPEPNAIFLDKTATFMFYRGLFGTPKHYTARYHPQGSSVLNIIDVLDWEGFVEHVRGAADDTPAGRLRARMGAALESDDQQAVVDAINAAMRDRSFFDAAAWSGIDWDAEYAELTAEGFSFLRRDRTGMNRANELLARRDFLARVTRDGIESLGDDELFRFNCMMLRAALDERSGPGLMARNREAALNAEAQNHPRRYTSWTNLFRQQSTYHPLWSPHKPTLTAWRMVSEKKEKIHIAVRNPYYYRVDPRGRQLPYIDAIETTIETERSIILLKLAGGHVDFQCRELEFENFTFLKENETAGDYEIRLWANDYVGEVTFFPLQAHKDPVLRRLQDDSRFRHALSLALNRQEIIDVVYSGIGEPAQFSVPKGSPYYSESHAKRSIEYDPATANRLLDEMGLDKRGADGTRVMWDGRPLILNVDTPSERPITVVQMACEYWQAIGVSARMKVRNGMLVRRMSDMGILDIGVHKEGGNYFAPLCAGGYAPTHPAECLQWNKWVAYIRNGGRSGWKPPARMLEIERLWNRVITAPDDATKYAAWQALSERTADDLPIIGLMTSPGKLIYVRNNFKNVPKLALAGWIAHEPGNCCPEAFFFDKSDTGTGADR